MRGRHPRFTPVAQIASWDATRVRRGVSTLPPKHTLSLSPSKQKTSSPAKMLVSQSLPDLNTVLEERAARRSTLPLLTLFDDGRDEALRHRGGWREAVGTECARMETWRATSLPSASSKLPELVQRLRDDMQATATVRRRQPPPTVKELVPAALTMLELLRQSVSALGGGDAGVAKWVTRWDADGNGCLSLSELRAAISDLCGRSGMSGALMDCGTDAVAQLFRALDRDGSGTVEMQELVRMIGKGTMRRQLDERITAEDLRASDGSALGRSAAAGQGGAKRREGRALRRAEDESAFDALDVDGSGMIDVEELVSYYISQGLSRDQVTELTALLDTDSSGTISKTEVYALRLKSTVPSLHSVAYDSSCSTLPVIICSPPHQPHHQPHHQPPTSNPPPLA